MDPELITSAQNPKIKRLLELESKSSERRAAGLFVVEGLRELQHCIDAGYSIDSIFLSEISFAALRHLPLAGGGRYTQKDSLLSADNCNKSNTRIFKVSKNVYEKIAYRESTEGIIAEVKSKSLSLNDLQLPKNPLILVLESVEKPGNLGAVLRTADAAGVDAVLVCDPLTDLYNPNLIRASIGAVFTVPTVACASSAAIDFLKTRGIQILTAQLQDSSLYYDCDMRLGTAIVMGTESTGLTDIWRKAADKHIRIPMLGKLDSLNVSVSASILAFEAVRQRESK